MLTYDAGTLAAMLLLSFTSGYCAAVIAADRRHRRQNHDRATMREAATRYQTNHERTPKP